MTQTKWKPPHVFSRRGEVAAALGGTVRSSSCQGLAVSPSRWYLAGTGFLRLDRVRWSRRAADTVVAP